MTGLPDDLLQEIRGRFANVDACPFSGPRAFFENAGGSLTLKSVVETSGRFAGIPDNPGRLNAAGQALQDLIAKSKADARVLFNAPGGAVFMGESGTELIFRLVRAAALETADGRILSATLEHPATRSAAARWAGVSGKTHVIVPHDDASGTVSAQAYGAAVTPDTRVVTIVHASPVTGMGTDVEEIAARVRESAPEAFIIVDGIQHAAHGDIDIARYDIDGYVISPYKVFSRHGYGIAWASDRLLSLRHDHLLDAPGDPWELGTRDAGAYATFSDVVDYFDWLGARVSDETERRARIGAASRAIRQQEKALTDAAIHGTGNLPGLADLASVSILGGIDNPHREGLVSFAMDGMPATEIVARLNAAGIRTHTRSADHYSGNVLTPLGLDGCVRVSFCHYNSIAEVAAFLSAMQAIAAPD